MYVCQKREKDGESHGEEEEDGPVVLPCRDRGHQERDKESERVSVSVYIHTHTEAMALVRRGGSIDANVLVLGAVGKLLQRVQHRLRVVCVCVCVCV